MRKPLEKSVQHPWDIPLSQRIQRLGQNPSKKRVMYLYERPDTSTFRYRVYNMVQALQLSDAWEAAYFFYDELEYLERSLKNTDLLIIARMRWSATLDAFIMKAKRLKIPVVFDVDDLVFDSEKILLLTNTLAVDADLEVNLTYWFSYISRLALTAHLCEATIGTHQFLADKLNAKFSTPSFVLQNFLNHEQLTCSEKLYKKKQEESLEKAEFTIGYFSGTPSHTNDFNKIAPELATFLEHYPQAKLEVVGFMEFPSYLKKWVKQKRIYHTPLVDFITLQEKISKVDVNIVPVIDNEFTNCKSELKFFEAAIVGTVTCATPLYIFKKSIQEGKTGYLCAEGEWFQALETIYQKKVDPLLSATARGTCIDKYAVFNQPPLIENVFDKLLDLD